MRALICTLMMVTACGTEQEEPDWTFTVTVSNDEEDCRTMSSHVQDFLNQQVSQDDVCSCTDADGSDCLEDISRSSETFNYEFYFDGDAVAIEIDGQPFASGTVLGCELEYESPTWLESTSNGEVQWSVMSHYVRADGASVCPIAGPSLANPDKLNNFLGVEEYTIEDSQPTNMKHPAGRVVRKVISGHAKAAGGE